MGRYPFLTFTHLLQVGLKISPAFSTTTRFAFSKTLLSLRDFPNKENHLKTQVEKSVRKDFSYTSLYGTFANRLCEVFFERSLIRSGKE